VQVAIHTGVPAGVWLDDPAALLTAVEVLNAMAAEAKRGR
jgi:hypothetical protein